MSLEMSFLLTGQLLLICTCVWALDPGMGPQPAPSCDRGRKIITGTFGTISSGNKDYPMDSHCEWLIKAPEEKFYISLKFTKMDTECSYDHIFVYDGDSYLSPILGSFSGNTTPPTVTSTQGSMLILLYSDTNYVRSGFDATFFASSCPMNCSNQGICRNHRCICDIQRTGNACQISRCPSECGVNENRGECNMSTTAEPECWCNPGYSGSDCSLPDSNKSGGNSWHLVASYGVIGRAAHSGTYVPDSDALYVFGGFAFRRVLGDTLCYSFRNNSWENISTENSPEARFGHASIFYHGNIIMFGGELANGSLSNEMWFFNVSSRHWSLMMPKSNFSPPPVTRHSVTLVDVYWLYVIGGSLSNGRFSAHIYRINIRDMNGWEIVDTFGAKKSTLRLIGHSAVYHQQTKTIFVYGGITADYSHVSKLTNNIYAFHVEKRYWIRLKQPRTGFEPMERAFHTAAVVGDYMVIYGGYTHKHIEEEICYDKNLHLYHLRCHKWIDFNSLKKDFPGLSNPIPRGVFSHSMGIRRGHTLLIFGGYSGSMRSELLAYVLPPAILSDQLLISLCERHKTIESCLSNLACGWCIDTGTCLERKNSKTCTKFLSDTCPGLCPVLTDCLSCVIWGQTTMENIISDRQEPQFPPISCSWCVQEMRCHSTEDQFTNCSVNSTQVAGGWWGTSGFDAANVEDCYLRDSPPGLISLKYKHPVNMSQPDDVSYLQYATEDINFRMDLLRPEGVVLEENTIRFIGFLNPMDARPLSARMPQLKLALCSLASYAALYLSNSTTGMLELAGHHNPKPSFYCSDILLNPARGQRVQFEYIVRSTREFNESTSLQLKWNAFTVDFDVIGPKNLELYKNGTCAVHHHCLSCLADSLCGWCESSNHCYPKSKHQVFCQKNGKSSYLVTHPANCSVCFDFIYCDQCVQVPTCEWMVETAICVRRGRFRTSVKELTYCPKPCEKRRNCVSCLSDPGMCAWCEESKTCFMFSTYTSTYAFGKCRDWVDENRNGIGSELCRNCSRHKHCSSCLKDLSCGWCSSVEQPAIGLCTDGDFSGPHLGSCFQQLKGDSNTTTKWSYDACPDVNECLWGMHDCAENATCYNTPDAWQCVCNVGFDGDGKTCIRACKEKCLNGYCSDFPDYQCVCDLGWAGEDCSFDCGCHNHSTCDLLIGVCDSCQGWTEGSHCERCMPGSYGDATTLEGCQKCNCNEHGDPDVGFCNKTSGVCFCLNNTAGNNCERCQDGYYGNPKENGSCYEECRPRKVITEAVEGKFGLPMAADRPVDCLWLITVHSALDLQSLLGPLQSAGVSLQVAVHQDLWVPCPHNHIYVYDGLPNFVASGHPNELLGAFCGVDMREPFVVTAKSGYLTVHFERGNMSEGFNASYIRLKQSDPPCCEDKYANAENCTVCTKDICPNNCSFSLVQGECDMVYKTCLCRQGFAGNDCSYSISHQLWWSKPYDFDTIDSTVSAPSSRMGHTLVTMTTADGQEYVSMFGGYSSKMGFLNELWFYDTSMNLWEKVITDYPPAARHFHAAAAINNSMFIFGGLGEGILFGDFWEYSYRKGWVQMPEIKFTTGVLKLGGCTLTAISKRQLILFGGFSPSYGFFDRMMEFNTDSQKWTVINSTGAQPIGLYGHTTVYHPGTESLYVYGGISFDTDTVAPSSNLYAFHYPTSQWYRLPPDNKVNKPQTRPFAKYYHSSLITENYLIVLGGRTSNGSPDQIPRPYAYIFSCNLWIPLTDEAIEMIGDWPQPLIAASATMASQDGFFFSEGKLYRLQFPSDACLLFSNSRVGCIQQTGCAFCSLSDNGVNQTFCWHSKDAQSKCYKAKEQSKFLPAVQCDSEWLEKRNCHQYTSCVDCVATWPIYSKATQVCQWCSNCRTGRCVPVGSSCDAESDCNIPRKVIHEPSGCPRKVCDATDCEKCHGLRICIWTRQVLRSSGFAHTLNKQPVYNWVCVLKEIQSASFPIESAPPMDCPGKCHQHTDCHSCLESPGGEGGWRQCLWSDTLQMCMSPSLERLLCENGVCGQLMRGSNKLCSAPCWLSTQSLQCLQRSKCGWCAFSGPKVDGRGLCMEGGIMGPTAGICRENEVMLNGLPLPNEAVKWLQMSEDAPVWNYLTRPPENECLNGHHNCDDLHEECVDTLNSFECHCKAGYKMIKNRCMPTCQQGCVNGTCVRPDVCQCNFGFVGEDCSVRCKCNGHSNCPGPQDLETCLECKNNTLGKHCDKCKPLYVGNPLNGGSCVSCFEYCHSHSSLCFPQTMVPIPDEYNQSYVLHMMEQLPDITSENAQCGKCSNNTMGKRCDQCYPGFFKAGAKLEDGCRPCECHGHGETCNPLNGESCNCQNNTENDRQCSQKNLKNMMQVTPCWQLQCSKCKEYFLGSPVHGHQCYRHMFLDKEYCFDPGTQGECLRHPSPLYRQQTVFFAVQPRYMNVDIRIVVDVTLGGIDFFLSAKEDAFIVEVDKPSGYHRIYIDEKYRLDIGYDSSKDLSHLRQKRRTLDGEMTVANGSTVVSVHSLKPKFGDARGLTTYVDVRKCEDFLLVRGLENRLIVTIPQQVHDLRTTRFYMILRGTQPETFGSLFFRQDQTRIDLFVFFSVFFSCFFLFLAACVVVWKVKQAFDFRHARRLHAAEMKHMASRPFGHHLTIIEGEQPSPPLTRRFGRHGKSGSSPKSATDDRGTYMRPLAVEPLHDGIAAIATVLVRMPGGRQSLVGVSLGSALVAARPQLSLGGLRAAMRRRTSHANV